MKFLDHLSPDTISKLEIPNGAPLIYELDGALQVLNRYYLNDPKRTEELNSLVARES